MAIAGPGPGLDSASYLQTRLTSVRAAITAIEGGAQSYSLAGRNVTRGSLSSLYQQEENLLRRLSRATSAAAGYNGMFGRGRVNGTGQS